MQEVALRRSGVLLEAVLVYMNPAPEHLLVGAEYTGDSVRQLT